MLCHPKHAFPEAKGSNPTAERNLLWVRHPFREVLNTGESHKKKPGGFFAKDGSEMKEVLGFNEQLRMLRWLGEE